MTIGIKLRLVLVVTILCSAGIQVFAGGSRGRFRQPVRGGQSSLNVRSRSRTPLTYQQGTNQQQEVRSQAGQQREPMMRLQQTALDKRALLDAAAGILTSVSAIDLQEAQEFRQTGQQFLTDADFNQYVQQVEAAKSPIAQFDAATNLKNAYDRQKAVFVSHVEDRKTQGQDMNVLLQFKGLLDKKTLNDQDANLFLSLYERLVTIYNVKRDRVSELRVSGQVQQAEELEFFLLGIKNVVEKALPLAREIKNKQEAERLIAEREEAQRLAKIEQQEKMAAQQAALQLERSEERVKKAKREIEEEEVEEKQPKKRERDVRTASQEERGKKGAVSKKDARVVEEEPEEESGEAAVLLKKEEPELSPEQIKGLAYIKQLAEQLGSKKQNQKTMRELLQNAQRIFLKADRAVYNALEEVRLWLEAQENKKSVYERERMHTTMVKAWRGLFSDDEQKTAVRDAAGLLLDAVGVAKVPATSQQEWSEDLPELGDVVSEEEVFELRSEGKSSSLAEALKKLADVVERTNSKMDSSEGFLSDDMYQMAEAWRDLATRWNKVFAKGVVDAINNVRESVRLTQSFSTKNESAQKEVAIRVMSELNRGVTELQRYSNVLANQKLSGATKVTNPVLQKAVQAFKNHLMHWIKGIEESMDLKESIISHAVIQRAAQEAVGRSSKDATAAAEVMAGGWSASNEAMLAQDKAPAEQIKLWEQALVHWKKAAQGKETKFSSLVEPIKDAIAELIYALKSVKAKAKEYQKDPEFIMYSLISRSLWIELLNQANSIIENAPSSALGRAAITLAQGMVERIDQNLKKGVSEEQYAGFMNILPNTAEGGQLSDGSLRAYRLDMSSDLLTRGISVAGDQENALIRLMSFLQVLREDYSKTDEIIARYKEKLGAEYVDASKIQPAQIAPIFEYALDTVLKQGYMDDDLLAKIKSLDLKTQISQRMLCVMTDLYASWIREKGKVKTAAQETRERLNNFYSTFDSAKAAKIYDQINDLATLDERIKKSKEFLGAFTFSKNVEAAFEKAKVKGQEFIEAARGSSSSSSSSAVLKADMVKLFASASSPEEQIAKLVINGTDVSAASSSSSPDEFELLQNSMEEFLTHVNVVLGELNKTDLVAWKADLAKTAGTNSALPADFNNVFTDATLAGAAAALDHSTSGGGTAVLTLDKIVAEAIKVGNTALAIRDKADANKGIVASGTAPNNFISGRDMVVRILKELLKTSPLDDRLKALYTVAVSIAQGVEKGGSADDAKTGVSETIKVLQARVKEILDAAEKAAVNIDKI